MVNNSGGVINCCDNDNCRDYLSIPEDATGNRKVKIIQSYPFICASRNNKYQNGLKVVKEYAMNTFCTNEKDKKNDENNKNYFEEFVTIVIDCHSCFMLPISSERIHVKCLTDNGTEISIQYGKQDDCEQYYTLETNKILIHTKHFCAYLLYDTEVTQIIKEPGFNVSDSAEKLKEKCKHRIIELVTYGYYTLNKNQLKLTVHLRDVKDKENEENFKQWNTEMKKAAGNKKNFILNDEQLNNMPPILRSKTTFECGIFLKKLYWLDCEQVNVNVYDFNIGMHLKNYYTYL